MLNNSAISYCSPQLFLPCDPQSRKQQHIHVCTRGDSADLCFYHIFRPTCCGTLWDFRLSTPLFLFFLYFFLGLSSCQVEVFTGGTLAGRCRRLQFDVPSVACSHDDEGMSLPESTQDVLFFPIPEILIKQQSRYHKSSLLGDSRPYWSL